MDTTETNIKMCEKAEEIQEIWKPSVGDIFVHKYPDGQRIVERNPIYYCHSFGCDAPPELSPWAINWEGKGDRYVWLPRQDQLQEMVCSFPEVFEKLVNEVGINDFNYGLEEMGEWELFGEYIKFTSMEQLWLAFVMKGKYNKIWDGEEWEKGSK